MVFGLGGVSWRFGKIDGRMLRFFVPGVLEREVNSPKNLLTLPFGLGNDILGGSNEGGLSVFLVLSKNSFVLWFHRAIMLVGL